MSSRLARPHLFHGGLQDRQRAFVGRNAGLSRAVGLAEACQRLGISLRKGYALLALGQFPVAELPRRGRSHHKFSSVAIDLYLAEADTRGLRLRG